MPDQIKTKLLTDQPGDNNGRNHVAYPDHANHSDNEKFSTVNMRTIKLGGVIVILGLILGGTILGYNVMNNEKHRGDFSPTNSTTPIKP